MVGAGGLAPYLVRAHLAARPGLERVLVWNRTRSRAETLAAALSAEVKASVEVADDLETAVPLADIVSCATATREPVLRGALLKPGTHVDIVGAFRPEMRETDDEVMRRAEIFVDHRQTTERSGDFLIPFASGVITAADVRADLFALCQGRHPGRTGAEAITLMKNGGGSHLDYYVAKYVVDRLEGRPFSTASSSPP
jgi:ornithine cyclodeaminase